MTILIIVIGATEKIVNVLKETTLVVTELLENIEEFLF